MAAGSGTARRPAALAPVVVVLHLAAPIAGAFVLIYGALTGEPSAIVTGAGLCGLPAVAR